MVGSPDKFDDNRYCDTEDLKLFICLVISLTTCLKWLSDFMDGYPLP